MGDQARRPIHEELLAIPGIAGADVEGDPTTPEGVRVQLSPGADPDVVGLAVKRVLADHGMRSQMTAPSVAPRSAPPPPEPRAVVNLADFDHSPGTVIDPEHSVPAPTAVEEDNADLRTDPDSRTTPGPGASDSVPLLGDVAVTQRGTGVEVSVSVGDRTVKRASIATEDGIDQSLLEAVCELLSVSPVPTLVSVTTTVQEGTSIVSVLVDDGAARRAGAAVSRGNRAWAVARAFWSAVSGPA